VGTVALLDRAVLSRDACGMLRVPLLVLPDPVDALALQSWVDVVADGGALRMLVDTGSALREVPMTGSLARRPVEGTALWDTGAGMTVVDRDWAESHPDAVTVLTETSDGTDATGNTVAVVQGWLASCTIGGVTFPDQPGAVVDLSELNAHLAIPIHLGLGLPQISQASWYMDFPQGR
jgi:hypothetical protein